MASTEKMREHLSPGHQSYAGTHSQKHGMYSMENSGPDNLIDPVKITRMSELREILRTQPGRDDVRYELALEKKSSTLKSCSISSVLEHWRAR